MDPAAGGLFNGLFDAFSERNRIAVDMSTFEWLVLDRFMKEGSNFYQEMKVLKGQSAGPCSRKGRGKGGKRLKLREKDPW